MQCGFVFLSIFIGMEIVRGSETVRSYYSSVILGEGTYYGNNEGKGHCSLHSPIVANAEGILSVAINKQQYDGSRTCGMCVEITGYGIGAGSSPINGTRLAFVNNECPECVYGDLDLAENKGGRWEIEWTAVECPTSGNLAYKFQGSQKWYQKLQIRNSPYPIESVAFVQDGMLNYLIRSADNHFVSKGSEVQSPVILPVHVVITDVFGRVVEDNIHTFESGVEIPGKLNFEGPTSAPKSTASTTVATTPTTTTTTTTSTTSTSTATTTTTVTTTSTTIEPNNNKNNPCASLWQQSGGMNHRDPTTCCDAPAASCEVSNGYYSQCRPTYTNGDPNFRQLWQQCGGAFWTGSTCCQIGICQYGNAW